MPFLIANSMLLVRAFCQVPFTLWHSKSAAMRNLQLSQAKTQPQIPCCDRDDDSCKWLGEASHNLQTNLSQLSELSSLVWRPTTVLIHPLIGGKRPTHHTRKTGQGTCGPLLAPTSVGIRTSRIPKERLPNEIGLSPLTVA
jgi:hypothetical protein